MQPVLVGSMALVEHIPNLRKPKDVDYFSDAQVDGAETFYHPDLEKWYWDDVATLNELYTIKVSHSYWDLPNGSWMKHMYDITRMQQLGAELIPELHDILYGIWEERYGKKQANLEQSPEDFFNGNVTRIYEHDSIHASVAYHDGVPLFNKILRDGHQVAVDKSKFNALPLETKFELVREEVYATALERQVIPMIGENRVFNINQPYIWALRKTITSFTKGWFPRFIVDHFDELREPDINYVKRHKENQDLLVRI